MRQMLEYKHWLESLSSEMMSPHWTKSVRPYLIECRWDRCAHVENSAPYWWTPIVWSVVFDNWQLLWIEFYWVASYDISKRKISLEGLIVEEYFWWWIQKDSTRWSIHQGVLLLSSTMDSDGISDMQNIPKSLRFLKLFFWVKREGDNFKSFV